jgi:hypothetical protein
MTNLGLTIRQQQIKIGLAQRAFCAILSVNQEIHKGVDALLCTYSVGNARCG